MTREILLTGETEKAICANGATWIARKEILSLESTGGAAQPVQLKSGLVVKGFPYNITVTEKAAGFAGW